MKLSTTSEKVFSRFPSTPCGVTTFATAVALLMGLQFPATSWGAPCVRDSPGCGCFDNTGAWDPTKNLLFVDLLAVAKQTVGTLESCEEDGGKPFYQMQVGINSSAEAQSQSWGLLFAKRSAWCSETVAYWHREAQVPYANGYKNPNFWWQSWQLRNTDQVRQWYKTEEALGLRGRWIDATELDLSDFQPGVNAPCPGAYQQIMGYDPDPFSLPPLFQLSHWSGPSNAHSQVISSMTVYHYEDGSVADFDVKLIEGNSGDSVNHSNVQESVPRYTPDGGEDPDDYLYKGRKIRGWGVDLDAEGNPLCMWENITHKPLISVVPDFGDLSPHVLKDPQDEAQVEDNVGFAKALQRWGGVRTSVNGNEPTIVPLPTERLPWVIEAGKRAVIKFEFPRPLPYPIGSAEIHLAGKNVPKVITLRTKVNDKRISSRGLWRNRTTLPRNGVEIGNEGYVKAYVKLFRPVRASKFNLVLRAGHRGTLEDLKIIGIDLTPYIHPSKEEASENL